MMIERGPCDDLPGYFEVVGAMLFYIDEFPERLDHPKETELLFPKVAQRAPETAELIARLDKEHARGEASIRELHVILCMTACLPASSRRRRPPLVLVRCER